MKQLGDAIVTAIWSALLLIVNSAGFIAALVFAIRKGGGWQIAAAVICGLAAGLCLLNLIVWSRRILEITDDE